MTPIEGDSLNKITKLSSINIRENEIRNLMELFPTACKNTMPEDIIKSLENSDFFSRKNCSPQKLYNKEFFYFADDKITFNPNLKFDNGQINIKNTYTENINKLKEFDLYFVEEPTNPDDILGFKKIKDSLKLAGLDFFFPNI